MQIAATGGVLGSVGSGCLPLPHSARTLPGVSAPSSVVRSTQRMARSSAYCFEALLMLRVASAAARASAPTWSTPGSPCRNRRSPASSRTTSAYVSTVAVMPPSLCGRRRGPGSSAAGPGLEDGPEQREGDRAGAEADVDDQVE